MATYNGIDVSTHQGKIDWGKVKSSGVNFAIIRAGYGKYISQKDSRFEENYKNAKAAGIPVGVYWYSYAVTEAEAKQEAAVFIEAIKGKTFEYPVALDIEDPTQSKLSVSTIDKIVTAFCSAMEKAGYYCMLYSYECFLQNNVSSSVRKKYDVWCANTSRKPSITYGIHQYSFKGSISGISGGVDLDTTTKNYPSIIKNAGLNGYKKSSTTENKTTSTATVTPTIKVGSKVKVKAGAKSYNGVQLASFVYSLTWIVKEVSGNRIVIDKDTSGKCSICTAVHKDNLILQ